MDWRQTTLWLWLSQQRASFAIGATADNPIEILDDEEPGREATNPITISDSEDDASSTGHDVSPDDEQQPPAHFAALWPWRLPYWSSNRGLENAQFRDVDLRWCKCTDTCPVGVCDNAKTATFCDDTNCRAGELCGNRLIECDSLRLMRCIKGIGVTTNNDIPPLTVVGEYCGYIVPRANLTYNQRYRGFVLKFKSRDTNGERVYIDADPGGSVCRFVNHSCSPNCRFEERSHRDIRKMVIVTERQILAGEELTVSYSKRVRFLCLCGAPNCQSKRN